MRPGRLGAAAVAVACALLPGAAQAATIPGSPLRIDTNDAGQIQVRSDGFAAGEFAPSGSNAPSAGLNVVGDLGGTAQVFGWASPNGLGFTPMGQEFTGTGTSADPFLLESFFDVALQNATVNITERITYVNGERELRVEYNFTNNQSIGPTLTIRPSLAGDLFTPGTGDGGGFLLAGPPRTVGNANNDAGVSGGIVESTAWAAFEAGPIGTLIAHLRDTTPGGGGLANSADPAFLDAGAGIEWPETTIPGFQTVGPFVATLRFPRFDALALSPAGASLTTGATHTVTVASVAEDGAPAAGRSIVYGITGANPGGGTATTDAAGAASISWTGNAPGGDTLTAFADVDGDGVRDPHEAQEFVTAQWASPPVKTIEDLDDPEPFREVNVEPLAGEVYVRVPGGSARASQLGGAPAGFVPLREAAQIPIGSQIEATRGRVLVESAASQRRGRTQRAQFYQGRFQIRQPRAARPFTEIVTKGGSFRGCPRTKARASGDPRADASQRRRRGRRVRRLWGDGSGRFRTRGRYSSATVRGTKWVVEDHCNGTLTRVARRPRTNRVVVRDFVRRRSVTLRAGQSYFAARR